MVAILTCYVKLSCEPLAGANLLPLSLIFKHIKRYVLKNMRKLTPYGIDLSNNTVL